MKDRSSKGAREMGPFVALPMAVLRSQAYRGLSPHAVKLLIDVCQQYGGSNNGQLLASRNKMKEFGWKSADTLTKALKELTDSKLLFRTVQGHRPNRASWYAITWRTLDKHDGYDPGSIQGFRRGMWQPMEAKAKPERDELYARWQSPPKTHALDRHTEQEPV